MAGFQARAMRVARAFFVALSNTTTAMDLPRAPAGGTASPRVDYYLN